MSDATARAVVTAGGDAGRFVALDFRIDPAGLDPHDRARLMIRDGHSRQVALGMLRRTRNMIGMGAYRDGSIVRTYRTFIEQTYRCRQEMIGYLEGELIVVRMASGYDGFFVLRWNTNAEYFVLQAAPSE